MKNNDVMMMMTKKGRNNININLNRQDFYRLTTHNPFVYNQAVA